MFSVSPDSLDVLFLATSFCISQGLLDNGYQLSSTSPLRHPGSQICPIPTGMNEQVTMMAPSLKFSLVFCSLDDS